MVGKNRSPAPPAALVPRPSRIPVPDATVYRRPGPLADSEVQSRHFRPTGILASLPTISILVLRRPQGWDLGRCLPGCLGEANGWTYLQRGRSINGRRGHG